MKKRVLNGLLCLCMILSLIPAAALAADSDSLFERFLPINQVYSAYIQSVTGAEVGKALRFSIGTRFVDEGVVVAAPTQPVIKRSEHQGHFIKVNYLGKYGEISAELADTQMNLVSHDDYLRIVGDPAATERPADYYPIPYDLTEDTLVVSIDMYDAGKKLVKTIVPACVIFAAGGEGDFVTFSRYRNKLCSNYFSNSDNLFAADADKGTNGQSIYITPTHLMLSDKSVAEKLLDTAEHTIKDADYEFIQYPALTGTPQYDTNIILSDKEFITPDGTYYQVGNVGGAVDPEVKNKIENVVSYSMYGHVLDPGYTRRNLVTADGTLYGVTTKYEKSVLATGVKKTTKNHYMTTDGTVKELDGKVVATDCKDYDEAYNDKVIGVLKNDNSFWLGYNYLAGGDGYAAGLSKVLDNAKTVVAGGVCDAAGTFYRWHEEVIKGGYDEGAWSRGEFAEYNEYKLSLKQICTDAVRVFPNERLTKIWGANQKDRDQTINGFVVDAKGEVTGYGIRYDQSFGELGMVERIFPVYESVDNGNFVGLKIEGKSNPYAIVARYCDSNEYRVGEIQAANVAEKPVFLCETQDGFKATDGNLYTYDNRPDASSTKRFEAVTSSNFGQMHRKTNTFQAYNFTDNASLPLLPSIARWRYDNKVICLLERTDGSMWMSAIHPKASAANLAAKLGGYENSNVFQITQPTSKAAPPSYVELAGGPSQTEKPNPTPAAAFSDVNAEAYYAGAVKWAVDKGITAGTSATTFSPSDTCTRAHILTFLWRAVGSPKSTANNPFSDVKADDYYYDAAIWASEKGMVTGNQFNGNTPCTRSSTVVYLWQNAGAPKTAVSNVFSDVSAGSGYAQAVAWAVKTGVTSGTSETTFSPDTICDRGQIVTFLNRAMK